jgi:putative protease
MNILAPVSGYQSAVKQIEAGANEIYVGGDTEVFNNFSFSGRAKFNPSNEKICPGFAELADIVQYAHDHNVFVMYAANTPVLADDPGGGLNFEAHFLKYIEQGLRAGVDSIIIADLGALLLLKERGIKTHLTASTFLETINRDQIEFLKELGANRVVLSYQVTMAEVKELSQTPDVEIEVFGHYGCSFYDGYCNFKHSFGESGATEAGIGVPCQNSFSLIKGERAIMKGQFLNASLTCGICALPGLMEAGVDSIKIVGRDLSVEQNATITSVYAQILKKASAMNLSEICNYETMRQFAKPWLPEWWIQSLCLKGSCKYMNNPITHSFTGLVAL